MRPRIFLLILATLSLPTALRAAACGARIGAYYADWNAYRSDKIPYSKFTHLFHAFVTPNADGSLSYSGSYLEPALLTSAHAAGVKVLVSLGTGSFAAAVASAGTRGTFINSIEAFVRSHGYDGVDIDWEGPGNNTEKANMTLFCQELRAKFNASASPAPNWLITMATGGHPWSGQFRDFPAFDPYIDFYNLMTYDMHGNWSNHISHNAALYTSPGDTDGAQLSMDAYISYLVSRGVAASKINAGMPLYGYQLNGGGALNAACTSGAPVLYRDIVPLIGNGWIYANDSVARVPYLIRNDSAAVITYDDPASIAEKTSYALVSRSAGGVFLWEIAQDYMAGSQPLLDAMVLTSQGLCPTASPTQSVTPSPVTTPTASTSVTPIQGTGVTTEIKKSYPVPNPNPSHIGIKTEGLSDSTLIKIYSISMACVLQIPGPGSGVAGWVQIPVGPQIRLLSNGIYFYSVEVFGKGGALMSQGKGVLSIAK